MPLPTKFMLKTISKRIVASLSALALVLAMVPLQALAANVPTDFVTSINFEVAGIAKDSFIPASAEQLTIKVNYDTAHFPAQLATANGTVKVKQGGTTVKTFPAINGVNVAQQTFTWDGKDSDGNFCSNPPGSPCANGTYTVEVALQSVVGADTWTETETKNFTIGAASTVNITTFTAVPTKNGGDFDPSPSGDDEDLTLEYTLSQAADVRIDIKNSKNQTIKNFNDTAKATGSFSWDGVFEGKLVVPGTYTLVLSATKAGESAVTSTKSVTVAYGSAGKAAIENYSLDPISFDPDFEDTSIRFRNSKDAELTVEIQDGEGSVVRSFSDYSNDSFNGGDDHDITWDGKNTSGTQVNDSSYKIVIVARNDFGVTVKEDTVTINNSAGSVTSSNNHIDNISFSPSSKFKPSEDEELKIEYDAKVDLDELTISAVRGNERFEIEQQEELESDTNLEATWDGQIDDEYAAPGTWKIEFKSKVGATQLVAVKSVTIEYEKPTIDEFIVSKSKFDNDLGESTFALFRLDEDAQITLTVVVDGNDEEDLEEELDVEKDRWYAVEFDGDGYDYTDDIDLKLTAANLVNTDVYDSEKISVDLAEDDTSSSVSNVTNDYIDPVVSGGDEAMTIYYELEDEADVTITIYKGKTSTGTKIVEVLDVKNQEGGDHEIEWNGRDSDGDKLSDGFYTYKIVSDKSSTDTESGVFVIGETGDNGSSSDDNNNDDSGDDNNNGNPNVIIDGGNNNDDSGSNSKCAGFGDVQKTSKFCESIMWAQESGVVKGYSDGTFKPFAPINRVEILKVVLEAMGIGADSSVSGNLGFKDVQADSWYMGYIKAGKDRGIFTGDAGKGTARPGDTVNRAEALKIAFETLRVQKAFVVNGCAESFDDVKSGDWFAKYACQAKEYMLFDLAGNALVAGKLSTRGEIVEMLYRMHQAGLI